ncbi:MAG: CGNR zinc finger domain-containing protein [Salinibacterium sp.]|nr:CGNR zinc finger domain-containing protein [Salinibacterium sp.]
MLFAPDTVLTLEFTVDLANTHPSASRTGLDELSTPASLTALVGAHAYSGRFDRDLAELGEVRETRELLRSIWALDRDAAALEVNRMLRDANALPFLMRHDHFDWHLHATPPDAPLAERIRVEVSLALMDVIRSDEMHRLRSCEAPDCEGLLVDLSRNGSKRFCSVRCGNRMNQLAYRERAGS